MDQQSANDHHREDSKPKIETFKVLDGAANDKGVKYEFVMTLLFSIQLAFDKRFRDFKISSNNEAFGNFDDVILEISSEAADKTIAVQLKHGKSDGKFTDGKLASDKKSDFGFRTYYKSYLKFCDRQKHSNLTLILYTNKEFTTKLKANRDGDVELQFSDQSDATDVVNCGYVVKVVKHDRCIFDGILNTSAKTEGFIYKLKIEPAPVDKKNVLRLKREEYSSYVDFFDKFFIYAGQMDADNVAELVNANVRKKFKFDELDKYKQYIKEWYDSGGEVKEKLCKEVIEDKIARAILEPYIVSPKCCQLGSSNEKVQLIRNAISSFRITFLTNSNNNKYINHIWEEENVPVILQLDESQRETVLNAIQLDSTKRRFVLIGIDSRETTEAFQNLSDLEPVNSDLFNRILDKFTCDFQGRRDCTLRQIAQPQVLKAIRVEHLVTMALEPFAIGDKARDIANPPYITRRVPKILIDPKSLAKSKNNVFVVDCLRENAHLKQHRKSNPGKVIVFEGKCPHFKKICARYRDKNIHAVRLIGDDQFEWVSTVAQASSNDHFPELEPNHGYFVEDADVLNHFQNNVNVLIADSGVGKSTMFDFFKLNAPLDLWPVKIDLMMHHKKFEHLNSLLECPDETTRTVQSLFEKQKRVLYLLDGIDVLQPEQIDLVLSGIKKLSLNECRIWIAAKSRLKDRLENEFGVFALTLTRADQNDQKHYIHQRLVNRYGVQEIRDIEEMVTGSSKDFQDMFAMPLTLFMFCDVWLKNQQTKPNAITDLYREFVEAKFDFHYGKVDVQTDTLIANHMNLLKALMKDQYVKAALKSCFNIDTEDGAYAAMLQDIQNGGDKFGFITSVNDDAVPIFTHQTYAEFLAASFLANNLTHPIVIELFEEKHENVRYMFDLLLAENSPGHLAVLQRNLDKLVVDGSLDKAGRNVLQLACSWGRRHPLLNTRNDGERCRNSTNTWHVFDSTKREDPKYMQMIHLLMKSDVFQTDQLFSWNALEYADQSLSLAALDVIAGFEHQIDLNDLNNYRDVNSVLSYAIKFGYVNLWKMINPKPFFHFEPYCINNILTLLVEYDRYEFFKDVIEGEFATLIDGCYKQRSLLALALHNDRFHIATILIDNNVDVNANYYNDYPILASVQKGNVAIAKRLLAKPELDVHVKDKSGKNVVQVAALGGLLEILEILQKQNYWSELQVNTVETLQCAIQSESLNVLKFLAENGLDLTHLDKYGGNALHMAVRRHARTDYDFHVLRYLVSTGQFDLDAADTPDSLTPLHTAVVTNKAKILEFLLSQGCDPAKLTRTNQNILQLASLHGNYDMAEHLITCGIVDPNGINLERVFVNRHLKTIEILLKHKVCIDFHQVAFRIAEAQWSSDSVRALTYLLAYGTEAAVTMRDGSGNTLLHHYVKNGSLENAKLLIEHGADINAINAEQETLLHLSAESNSLQMVEFVLASGLANRINDFDGNKHSVLHRAVKQGNLEMVKLLLRHSADVRALCTENKRSVLHLAARKHHFEVLTFLLGIKFQANAKDARGNTVLYYVISGGDLPMTRYLITEHGYATDVLNNLNMSLLHSAAYGRCLDTVRYLVETLGLDPNRVDDLDRKPIELCHDIKIARYLLERTDGSGVKLLHNAVQCLYHDIVQFLAKHVADVNAVDEMRGNSALHYVALHKNYNARKNVLYKVKFKKIVLALLQAGADFRLENRNGETPLSIAEARGEDKLVEIFLDHDQNKL